MFHPPNPLEDHKPHTTQQVTLPLGMRSGHYAEGAAFMKRQWNAEPLAYRSTAFNTTLYAYPEEDGHHHRHRVNVSHRHTNNNGSNNNNASMSMNNMSNNYNHYNNNTQQLQEYNEYGHMTDVDVHNMMQRTRCVPTATLPSSRFVQQHGTARSHIHHGNGAGQRLPHTHAFTHTYVLQDVDAELLPRPHRQSSFASSQPHHRNAQRGASGGVVGSLTHAHTRVF